MSLLLDLQTAPVFVTATSELIANAGAAYDAAGEIHYSGNFVSGGSIRVSSN